MTASVPPERQRGATRSGPLLGLAVLAIVGLAIGFFLRGGSNSQSRVVSVYTAHGQNALDVLVPRFEAETGIQVQLVKLGSGEVVQRVQAERAAPRCDVIWSIGGDQLASNAELLERFRPPAVWDALAASHQAAVGKSPWLPYTVILPVLLVNTKLLPPGTRPKGWEDLRREDLAGKLSTARADKSGSAFLQVVTILRLQGEEPGWDLIDVLLERAVLSGSSSAVPRFVNDGEALVGLTLEDNAQRYVRGGGPVEIVYPIEGTCAAPDGMALVKGAPHRAEAEAFITWALSKGTQAFLVKTLGRRSVRGDVPPRQGSRP
ncbi:MAG: extracellular solute-binding protein [Planctomycetes bacterium]|nr:extracellular solute-binding protein [Planctomycetota bacterium]